MKYNFQKVYFSKDTYKNFLWDKKFFLSSFVRHWRSDYRYAAQLEEAVTALRGYRVFCLVFILCV